MSSVSEPSHRWVGAVFGLSINEMHLVTVLLVLSSMSWLISLFLHCYYGYQKWTLNMPMKSRRARALAHAGNNLSMPISDLYEWNCKTESAGMQDNNKMERMNLKKNAQ